MTVGIVGLGLIGGSAAKAYSNSNCTVLGSDANPNVLSFAQLSGVVDAELSDDTIGLCDCIIIAINPGAAVEFLKEKAKSIPKNCLVIDCCGVKRTVCEHGFDIAAEHGFVFVGGHPMAGSHYSGFKYSRDNMFKGASMLIVPPVYDDITLLDAVATALKPLDFGKLIVTTAQKHDRIIAITSQLAHIVSNAYIKSPNAAQHRGYSAGSFKDLTRVAKLNSDMWAELFAANSDNLLSELDFFIASLQEYREALSSDDTTAMRRLLHDGSILRDEIIGG